MPKKIKRKNNDAKDAVEYGAMVFRQDDECASSLDGAVLLPDGESCWLWVIGKWLFEERMKNA